MGFYGNITNTSKTTFTFDKIYSNRLQMDNSCTSDGIFLGRYVLVEYGLPATQYLVGYLDNKIMYDDHLIEVILILFYAKMENQ